MKKLIILSLSLILLGTCPCISANIINTVASFFGEPKTYEETGIGIEILNKTGKSIWVTVINAQGFKGWEYDFNDPVEIKPSGLLEAGSIAFKTNINQKTALAIWQQKPKSIEISNNILSQGTWGITPKPDWLYEVEGEGKTIYVTIDKNGIRPQTGPRGGNAGKTNSGLSLKQNITQGNLKKIS